MPRKRKTSTGKAAAKKEVEFIDGKTSAEEEHKLSMDIEAILSPPKNPFGMTSLEELENSLKDMNLRQMQELAVKASVFPSGNKTALKNKIKKEFVSKFGATGSKQKFTNAIEKPIVDPDSELAKDIIDILNER
jgi:hypothetical protein